MKSNINQKSSRYGIATIPNLNGSTPHQPTSEELGEKQDSSFASPKGPRMKAVLEFTYPQDEHRLQHALKGSEYYDALCDIDEILASPLTKADAYSKIRKVIFEVLEGT
jgi:hypothetical protein